MKARTALLLAFVVIATMFVFEASTKRAVMSWAQQATELTEFQRLRAATAFTWGRFWWVLSPAIVLAFLGISALTQRHQSDD